MEVPFEGPIWENLYARFGTNSSPVRRYWFSEIMILNCAPSVADEIAEMERIGVPCQDALIAVIGRLAEKNELLPAQSVHCIVPVSEYLFDIQAMVALHRLIDNNFLFEQDFISKELIWHAPQWHFMKLSERNIDNVFPNRKTSALARFLWNGNNNVHLGLAEYFMDYGGYNIHPPEAEGLDSPMLMALLGEKCIPVVELMARRNVDFRFLGTRNPFGIPDAILVAVYHNPSILPVLLKLGGMALEVPVSVSPPQGDKTYRQFVCCELRRFRGMLELLSEFSLILPLCAKCKDASHLESSIPSLQSICRMTYRSLFKPSELLADDLPLHKHYPELYCEYLRFEDSPFDSLEFKAAMEDRIPGTFHSPMHYLSGEDIDREEA